LTVAAIDPGDEDPSPGAGGRPRRAPGAPECEPEIEIGIPQAVRCDGANAGDVTRLAREEVVG
jgi:hypothetical protein